MRQKTRVLIVEDEIIVGLDLADALKEEGFDPYGPYNTSNGALEAFEKVSPEVGIFDGEIELTRQTPQFDGCSETVDFPDDLTIQEAVVTSYSGNHWTDVVQVNGETVYNLSNFLVDYTRLGDPYRVNIPPESLTDTNTLSMRTGDSPDNFTGCSDNNTLIYTARVPGASASTPVRVMAR